MTEYRAVVRHVRYWRGVIQRWSTVYPFTGSLSSSNYGNFIAGVKLLDGGMCYSGNAIAMGGIYEIALYNQASGGVPIAVNTYFNYETPAAWVAYTSGGWPSVTAAAGSAEAETALVVEWAAGLSVKGKPVSFKKWYHAVPVSSSYAGPDISAAQVTSLQNYAQTQLNAIQAYGPLLGNSSRLAATLPTVRSQFGNHQMPRGRRRKPVSPSGIGEELGAFLSGVKSGYDLSPAVNP